MIKKARLSRVATLEEYHDWLCDLINNECLSDDYSLLLTELYKTPFEDKIPNDENRAFEGLNLREVFSSELGIAYIPDNFNPECSMLELIIGLAYRCESIGADEEGSLNYKEWFWRLLDNAGLTKFDDNSFFRVGEDASSILRKIIERRYDRDGHGGFFPLNRSTKDQRRVELWYQMSSYLSDMYYPRD